MVEDDKITTKVLDPMEYDEIVTTKDSETIDAFSSRIIEDCIHWCEVECNDSGPVH